MTKRRAVKIALIALAALLIAFLAVLWILFGTQLRAALTVKKLGDGLWSMEYTGDYGFDEFLERGGAKSDAEMADYIAGFMSRGFWDADFSFSDEPYGCSAISVKSPEGSALFGRNFDWQDCDIMLIRTAPPNGYKSISTCCLDFLGFGEDWEPDGGFTDRFMALAAVYVPLDGMNEKGLCVAELMVSRGQAADQDTEKPDLTTTSAIRMLLDNAADVDEALELLGRYDMNFSIGAAHHFAVSDASGRCVAVEWKNGDMIVTETPVVTNHYISGDDGSSGSGQSYIRFETLTGLRQNANGTMTKDGTRDALAAAAQGNFIGDNGGEITCWSLIYDRQELTARFYVRENWESFLVLSPQGGDWIRETEAEK